MKENDGSSSKSKISQTVSALGSCPVPALWDRNSNIRPKVFDHQQYGYPFAVHAYSPFLNELSIS